VGRVAVREAVLQCDEYIFIKARVSKKNHIYPHSTILKQIQPGTPERGQRGASDPPTFYLGEQGEQKCSF